MEKNDCKIISVLRIKKHPVVSTDESIESVMKKINSKSKYISIMGWTGYLSNTPRPYYIKTKKIKSVKQTKYQYD